MKYFPDASTKVWVIDLAAAKGMSEAVDANAICSGLHDFVLHKSMIAWDFNETVFALACRRASELESKDSAFEMRIYSTRTKQQFAHRAMHLDGVM